MKTKTELDAFCLTSVNTLPNLSDTTLEVVAMDIARQPEFPARLPDHTRIAFSRACFTLMCRYGNGRYDSFDENPIGVDDDPEYGRNAMHAAWQSYAEFFCPEGQMKEGLIARLGTAGALSIEQLESVRSAAVAEPLLQATSRDLLEEVPVQHRPDFDDASRDLAVVQARSKVLTVYNNLP